MTDVDQQVVAPFTPDQVLALNAFQRSGWFHSFTCGNCRDTLGTRDADDNFISDRELVATVHGWICPTCDYTQNWAWRFMANYDPKLGANKLLLRRRDLEAPE